MKLRNIFVLLALLHLGNIYSVIVSLSLFEKGAGAHTKKRILVIGNQHANHKQGKIVQDDKRDSQVFFDWLKGLDEKIGFLIEGGSQSQEELERLEKSNSYTSMCIKLQLWAMRTKLQYKNLMFSLVEIRSNKFNLIQDIIQVCKWQQLTQPWVPEAIRLQSMVAHFKTSKQDCTVKEFLDELDSMKDTVNKKLKSLPDLSKLENKIINFESGCKFLSTFLKNKKEQASMVDLITNLSNSNPEETQKLIDEYSKLSLIVGDLAFLSSIFVALEYNDNIIIYCGAAHAEEIINYLKSYSAFEAKYINGLENVDQELKPFNAEELQTILNSAYKSQKKENFCANIYCTKSGNMRCGRCKAVHYCCAKCQKEHWENHKPHCKPHPASANIEPEHKKSCDK